MSHWLSGTVRLLRRASGVVRPPHAYAHTQIQKGVGPETSLVTSQFVSFPRGFKDFLSCVTFWHILVVYQSSPWYSLHLVFIYKTKPIKNTNYLLLMLHTSNTTCIAHAAEILQSVDIIDAIKVCVPCVLNVHPLVPVSEPCCPLHMFTMFLCLYYMNVHTGSHTMTAICQYTHTHIHKHTHSWVHTHKCCELRLQTRIKAEH